MISRSLCQKALACALLLSLPSAGLPAEPIGNSRTITLDRDLTLRLQSITPHRTTPYLYVDQGLQTIEAIGRQQVLMSRRYGTLGGQPPVQYSLIAFTDKASSSDVSIHGQVLIGPQAWEYQAIAKRDSWQESILLVIEALTTFAEPQGVDRSKPPTDATSAGGFTIRRLSAPIVVDGEQWFAAQPHWSGDRVVNAPAGQYTLRLAQPNEDGDVVRSHLTFSEPDGKPVSLSPDVVSYALSASGRWIFYEPIEVVDVRTWRRYRLSKQFGIGPYVTPVAVSANGQRLVFSRRDCPVDCQTQETEYFEVELPD